MDPSLPFQEIHIQIQSLKILGHHVLKTDPPGFDVDPAILAPCRDMTPTGILGEAFHVQDSVGILQFVSQFFVHSILSPASK